MRVVPAWVRLIQGASKWKYRQATWWLRRCPAFIIIGAQKAGTNSLYFYLAQHTRLVRSVRKEIHFFDGGLDPKVDNFERGLRWYRCHFPMQGRAKVQTMSFEASPLYLFNPLAAKRIYDVLPEVRLIALLRNPVERAISHYFHEKELGVEPLPIMQALRAEEERLEPVLDRRDYKNDAFIHYSYKSRGLYYEQLRRYLRYFPAERLLIVKSETLFQEPDRILRRVFRFLGINEEIVIPDVKPRNVATNRAKVEANVYDYLEEYFRPHNQMLYELLGEDLGW